MPEKRGRGGIGCVLYHRVSTLDQDPTLARDELRQQAAARGWTVIEQIEETGSGANNDRPGLVRALATAKGRPLLVWKLDRFGRSVLDIHTNINAHVEKGGRFIATSQGLDVRKGDAMSAFFLAIMAAFAELERNLIRERTRLGLDKAVKAGKVLGRPPGAKDKKPRRKKGGRVLVFRPVEPKGSK